MVAIFGVLCYIAYWALKALENQTIQYLNILLPVLVLISSLSLSWVFVMQSRYTLSMKDTLLFSFTRIIAFPLRTLGMGAAFLMPFILTIYFPKFFILVPLLGVSGAGIISTCFYNSALKVMEETEEGEENESESPC